MPCLGYATNQVQPTDNAELIHRLVKQGCFNIGHVLIVDDAHGLAHGIKRQLHALTGLRVETATDFASARDLIINNKKNGKPFDLIVTDTHFGLGDSGFDVIKYARELIPDIKTILMSTMGTTRFEPVLGPEDPDAFLSKNCSHIMTDILYLIVNLEKTIAEKCKSMATLPEPEVEPRLH